MGNEIITDRQVDRAEMKELIKIKENGGVKTVSARELHEKLEVTERFSRWFDSLLKYGFEENKDFTSVKTSTLVNNGAERELTDYAISLDMAKEICMIQRSETGRKFRQYFIDCEKALKEVVFRLPQKSQQEIDNETKKLSLAEAEYWRSIGIEYSDNKTYKQILDAYSTKAVAGKFVLPLPKLDEENFSATEVGKLLGISANKVGAIAKRLDLKKDGEYGRWYLDKSPYSNKEVNTFRYTQKAVDMIRREIA